MANVSIANPAKRRAPFALELWRSAVGKKFVMAITGLFLIVFLLGHMIGNLKMYLGAMPDTSEFAYHIDEYGEFLRKIGEPILPHTVFLWLFRFAIIAAFGAHMHAAVSLTLMNRRARTVRYQSKRDFIAASYAARTMRYTGVIVILFVVWHLADLTWGVKPIASGDYTRGEVYSNVVHSFDRPLVAILYVIANIALGTHLFHGAWSFFQSLGINSPRFNAWRKWFAMGIAGLIVVGNVSFPLAVLFKIVHL